MQQVGFGGAPTEHIQHLGLNVQCHNTPEAPTMRAKWSVK